MIFIIDINQTLRKYTSKDIYLLNIFVIYNINGKYIINKKDGVMQNIKVIDITCVYILKRYLPLI